MGVYVRNNTIWISFAYKGILCRESLKIPDSKQNRVYAKRVLGEIKNKIFFNQFDYQEYFPDSKKLKIFGVTPANKKNIKFKDYANKWIDRKKKEYEAGQLKFSTLKSYQQGINRILNLSFFSEEYVNNITVTEIKSFITDLCKRLNNKTVVNTLTPLRQIFEDLFYDGIIRENPMLKIKNPKLTKPEIFPFSQEEILRILDYFEKEYNQMYALIATMFYTGMRTGEALAMKWENLDFNKWTYFIKESFSRKKLTTPKTASSIREIKIPPTLQQILLNHKKYSFMKSDFIFLNYYGKPYVSSENITRKYWKPALKELGIQYRVLYQLRHTHAMLSLIAGDSPHDVAKRLGHTSLQMLFNRYARFLKKEEKDTKLEDLINPKSNSLTISKNT